MGYRSFTDSAGVDWQIWDVVPRSSHPALERRRVPRDGDTAVVPPQQAEAFDRRSGARGTVPAGMAAGWLCFESADQKRRLTPIPAHWERMTDGELDALCQAASVVEPLNRVFKSDPAEARQES
jgi:hypothetical protein